MSDPTVKRLIEESLRLRYSRRTIVRCGSALGLSASAIGGVLAQTGKAGAQDSGPVTVNWFAARDTTGVTQQQVDEFNAANTAIQISYQEQGATTTDLHDRFVTVATAQDSSADIVSMDVPFVPEFAAAGWTIPMEEYLPAEERDAFFAGTIEGATYDGQLYGIPWFNNGPGLFYRRDLLEEAALEVPATYDELLAAATQLQTPELSGFIFQAAQTEGGLISWLEYLWGYGGELLDADGNVILGESSAGVDAMQRLVDFIYNDQISPEACLTMTTAADAENVFVSGQAAFLRMWMTSAAAMEGEASQVAGLWDVTTLPSQDGAEPGPGCLGTWNLGISTYSERQAEAAEVIRHMTSLEQQTARYLAAGHLPARSAVFDDPEVQETYTYVDRLRPAFEALRPRPVTPFYPQMSADALQPNFGAAMVQQKDPQQAIQDMADGLRMILG